MPQPPANNQFTFDDPGSLEHWEPWCRAAVFDAEVLSQTYFTPRGSNAAAATGATLHYWSVTAGTPMTATADPIVTLIPPTIGIFRSQLDLVASYADLREDRATEILAQLGPQYAFWSSIVPLHPTRNKWTLELLDTALRFANYVEMQFKQTLACPRPMVLSPQIQPIILTPGHGALPSGHSTEAHIVASILWSLCQQTSTGRTTGLNHPAWCKQLMQQAARIAINRTVAGVHYPVDSAAGQLLGLTLAEFFLALCNGGSLKAWTFDGATFPPTDDFYGTELFNLSTCQRTPPPSGKTYAAEGSSTNVARSNLLGWLWDKARVEWWVP